MTSGSSTSAAEYSTECTRIWSKKCADLLEAKALKFPHLKPLHTWNSAPPTLHRTKQDPYTVHPIELDTNLPWKVLVQPVDVLSELGVPGYDEAGGVPLLVEPDEPEPADGGGGQAGQDGDNRVAGDDSAVPTEEPLQPTYHPVLTSSH